VLLVAETIHFSAVRTLPGDMIAGHAPHIFLHASLANLKTAAATPAKGIALAATMALLPGGPPPAASGFHFFNVVHGRQPYLVVCRQSW
jgi:hypothetical protein